MGDDITIGVTEIVNNIEVTAQPNDQIVDISVIDNADDVTLNITPTVIEINVNKGSSYAKWGTILGTLSDQTDLQDALDLKADLVDGKVPSSQLPSYVDDVIEVANYAALPVVGESGKIYITLDDNHIFRWTGSIYVEITDNTAVWGAITGTLSSQSDLQSALNAKVPYSGATSNVNLGEYGLTSGYVGFDTTPTGTPSGIGTMYWDTANRTVSLIDGDGDTTLQIGQEERILVHNNTGSTLTDGQVVYVTGSTGELPSVSLANASNESTSATTIGVVTESIANGADGFITTSGLIHGLNTLAFTEGDLLWLGTTAGTYTNTKPTSPNHLVLIGYVIKRAGGNGSILVKIQNTQELEESSDVLFSGLSNNQVLTWESATSLWKNKSIATILGYTPANDSNVVHKTGNESIAGWKTFTGGITIWDNTSSNLLDFYVNGTEIGSINVGTSYMQFSALNSGGYLFKNNAGVNSLTLTNSGVATFLNSVTATSFIKSGGTSSQFLKADGSVDSTSYQPLLTNPITGSLTTNYIPKATGATTLGNSLIYDNGTKVGIGTTSPSSLLHLTSTTSPYLRLQTTNGAGKHWAIGVDNAYSNGLNFSEIGVADGRLFLQAGGNVGIGTTSPDNGKLTILKNTSNATESSYGIAIQSNANNAYTELLLGADDTVDCGVIQTAGKNTSFTSKKLALQPQGGNVGIGTTSPAGKLSVIGDVIIGQYSDSVTNNLDIRTNKALFTISPDGVTNGNGTVISYSWANGGQGSLKFSSASGIVMTLTAGGTVNVTSLGTGLVYSNGGTLTNTNPSDSRLKDNITDLNYGLNEILQLRPVSYNWKNDVVNQGKQFGFIAQEVQEVMPELVKEFETEEGERLGLDKEGIYATLVNAIKELKAEIEILKNK